jgi:hypothetical protein
MILALRASGYPTLRNAGPQLNELIRRSKIDLTEK